MGVHGGHMGRSLSRFSVLAGSAVAVGCLIAGCAANVPGPAVIVAPAAAASVAAAPSGNFLAGLEQAVANELSAINTTQSDNEPPQVLVELNALSSEGSLIQAENFAGLVTTGSNQILKRERLVNELTVDVKSSTYLNGVSVGGRTVSSSILALLSSVSSQLQAQANSIDAAQVPDILREVITSIGPSTRVFGLVESQIHLAIAAGEELNAARILAGQYSDLVNKVRTQISNAKYPSVRAKGVSLLADLQSNIATVTSNATNDLNAVLALTPAGYPGNKATILSVRAQLTQFRSPLGQLNSAATDVNDIDQLIAEVS